MSTALSSCSAEVADVLCINDNAPRPFFLGCRVPIMLVGNKNDLHMERYVPTLALIVP